MPKKAGLGSKKPNTDAISKKAMEEFLSEAEELLERFNANLLGLDEGLRSNRVQPEVLNEIFRVAHSLKGLAGMFGFEEMNTLAHTLENLLDDLRMGRSRADRPALEVLFECSELLGALTKERGKGSAETKVQVDAMRRRLEAISQRPEQRGQEDLLNSIDLDPNILSVLTEYEEHRLAENVRCRSPLYRIRACFDLLSFDRMLSKLNSQLTEVAEIITTLPSVSSKHESEIEFLILIASSRAEEEIRTAVGRPNVDIVPVHYLKPKGASAAAAEDTGSPPHPDRQARPEAIAKTNEGEPALPAESAEESWEHPEQVGRADSAEPSTPESLKSLSETVRVDIRRLDYLMHLIGDLILSRSAFERVAGVLRAGPERSHSLLELDREIKGFGRKIASLQNSILEVRMVPLRQIFDKMARIVRKFSLESHKDVLLEVEGADTELDKLIVEELADPLMHIVRNAVDHGIEDGGKRRRLGKPETGTVRLHAFQKGNYANIIVSDDGSGLDPERIYQQAVSQKLVSAGAIMSTRDIFDLIFLPGFSTREQATTVSGRGFGMNIVKHSIARLRGIIHVESETNKGTTFSLLLPTTLAMIQALIVRSGDQEYAIPVNSVVECLSVPTSEVRFFGNREVVSLREVTLPLFRLEEVFNCGSLEPCISEEVELDSVRIIVLGLAEERLGLVVDSFGDQQDIVLKPLGRGTPNVAGIAGATELGGRRVVLVIDAPAILEEAIKRTQEPVAAKEEA